MKKHKLDTPRSDKLWSDVVNSQPMSKQAPLYALALGSCDADGSNFKPYDKPKTVVSPLLWRGDFTL